MLRNVNALQFPNANVARTRHEEAPTDRSWAAKTIFLDQVEISNSRNAAAEPSDSTVRFDDFAWNDFFTTPKSGRETKALAAPCGTLRLHIGQLARSLRSLLILIDTSVSVRR